MKLYNPNVTSFKTVGYIQLRNPKKCPAPKEYKNHNPILEFTKLAKKYETRIIIET